MSNNNIQNQSLQRKFNLQMSPLGLIQHENSFSSYKHCNLAKLYNTHKLDKRQGFCMSSSSNMFLVIVVAWEEEKVNQLDTKFCGAMKINEYDKSYSFIEQEREKEMETKNQCVCVGIILYPSPQVIYMKLDKTWLKRLFLTIYVQNDCIKTKKSLTKTAFGKQLHSCDQQRTCLLLT